MINELLDRLKSNLESLEDLYFQPERNDMAIGLTYTAINEYLVTLRQQKNEISEDQLDQINILINRVNELQAKVSKRA